MLCLNLEGWNFNRPRLLGLYFPNIFAKYHYDLKRVRYIPYLPMRVTKNIIALKTPNYKYLLCFFTQSATKISAEIFLSLDCSKVNQTVNK